MTAHRRFFSIVAACLALAGVVGVGTAAADETCNSPYISKLIKGQEDFVYVWALGVEGVGDGFDKLSGRSEFTDDVHLPGMLQARIVRSHVAHARILNIDTSAAEKIKGKVVVQRFKGLGEMNPMQLRETTIAPETRRLVQLTVASDDDTHQLMDMLLARKRAADRRSWLEASGDMAEI